MEEIFIRMGKLFGGNGSFEKFEKFEFYENRSEFVEKLLRKIIGNNESFLN